MSENIMKAGLSLMLYVISLHLYADEVSIEGFWKTETESGDLLVSIQKNDNGHKVFYISGSKSLISERFSSILFKPLEMTQNFFDVNDYSSFTIPFTGVQTVRDPESRDGGTKEVPLLIERKSNFSGDQLSIEIYGSSPLAFQKLSFLSEVWEVLKLGGSTIVTFALWVIAFILYLKVTINRSGAFFSSEVDRRFKVRGSRLKGGGSYKGIFLSFLFFMFVIFSIYHFLLGFLSLGGFLDHVVFWMFYFGD